MSMSARTMRMWGNTTFFDLGHALLEIAADDSNARPRRVVFQFCSDRWEVPLVCLVAYLTMVWWALKRGPQKTSLMPSGAVDAAFAGWNLTLSLFSLWGCYEHAVWLFTRVSEQGMRFTICSDPLELPTFGHGTLSLFLFTFSKIPELVDTVFLILKGKPIRFLQWYHHSTVMIFCWLAVATEYTPGIWFAATNYLVHAVMYMYFFLMTFGGLRGCLKVVAPFVTILQTSQMVLGLLINGFAVMSFVLGYYCHVQDITIYCAVVMYASYFVLFGRLFTENNAPQKEKFGPSAAPAQAEYSSSAKDECATNLRLRPAVQVLRSSPQVIS